MCRCVVPIITHLGETPSKAVAHPLLDNRRRVSQPLHAGHCRQLRKNAPNSGEQMNLEKPFGAIKALDSCELPDFAVLIGRNGVGKTQLLNGIAERRITGLVRASENIEKYDIASFRPDPAQRASLGASLFAERTAEKYIDGTGKGAPRELAKEIHERTIAKYRLEAGTAKRREFESVLRGAIDIPDFKVFSALRVRGGRPIVSEALMANVKWIT